jgi:hypothetical protein
MHRREVQPLSMALSALSFGGLGWLVAHGLTNVLLAHENVDGRLHVHGYFPSTVVAAGSLAVASLLAVFWIGGAARGRMAASQGEVARGRADVRTAVALSASAYVVAEFGERWWAGDHQLSPPLVLLVGLAIYLFVGVGASVLWRVSVRAVRRIARGFQAGLGRAAGRLSAVAVPATVAMLSRLWPHVVECRGPPVLSV